MEEEESEEIQGIPELACRLTLRSFDEGEETQGRRKPVFCDWTTYGLLVDH